MLKNVTGLASGTQIRRRSERGVATLVVVVLLYVAMALIVVFTNRSLIFEQKSSANQYRSTLALEAAEAGLEWATGMLNRTGKVNDTCGSSTNAGDTTFKERYLLTNENTGALTPNAGAIHAACISNQNGTGWNCSCPTPGTAPSPAPQGGSGFFPSFAVVFEPSTTAGTVHVTSYGCTSAITTTSCNGDAAARVRVSLGQLSGLATPPAAPLTARGRVDVGNAALGVQNGDPTSNGITINAGMGIDGANIRLATVPGTPPKSSMVGNDSSLRETTEDQMFQTFFGMPKSVYKTLDGVKQFDCSSGCTENTVQDAYTGEERSRIMWFNGNLNMNANMTIGSETDPVILIVDGSVEMRGTLRIFGVIYSTGITWDNTGGGGALLQGAAISEGNYTGNGTPDYFYDPRVLGRLKYSRSSFVRVPGSWRDF